jgi:DNA modification methylase
MLKDTLKRNEAAAANADALAVLRENFADCFTKEGAFDLKTFAARIRDKVSITEEGYQLDFLGNNYARLLANEETETVIVPDEAHNAKPENAKSQNVYISGDNLDALKHLLKSYEHEVKCIYIDPPYNTGSDGFVYNDNFKFKPDELARKLSITEEEAKKLLDFVGRGSASHSAWLMFMYPRLQLAKSLLRDDGVIFISIDDNEQANLKLLCDDIFGEQNFLANIIWKRKRGRDNSARWFSKAHEYALVYARRVDSFDTHYLELDEETKKAYKNTDNDPRGPHRDLACWARGTQGGVRYEFTTKNGVRFAERLWLFSKANMEKMDQEDRLVFHGDNIYRKLFLRENAGKIPETLWDSVSNAANAADEIKDLFGAIVFDTPKPVPYVTEMLKIATDTNSLVLDFFSGSGTTAEAIMRMNAKALGKETRRYILVQWQERCNSDSVAFKEGYKTIDEIGQERIKKAANKIHAENPLFAGDLGFKHFTLKRPSGDVLEKIEAFDPKTSMLATQDMLNEFGVGTVLATWLNHDGYGLTREAEKVDLAGYEAYLCGHHLYLVNANFGAKNVKALLEKYETDKAFTPDKIVLFGYSFGWKELEELDTNLKKLKTTRNITADLDIRY